MYQSTTMISRIFIICILATCAFASKPYIFDAPPGYSHEGCPKKAFMLFYSADQKATYYDAQKKCASFPGGKLAAVNSANINYIANHVHRVIGNEYGVACWIGSWNTDPYKGCLALGQGLHIGTYPDEPRPFLCEFCVETPVCDSDSSCNCRRPRPDCDPLEDRCCRKCRDKCPCPCPGPCRDKCPCNRYKDYRYSPYEEIIFTEEFTFEEIDYDRRRFRPASGDADEVIYGNTTNVIKEVIVDKQE